MLLTKLGAGATAAAPGDATAAQQLTAAAALERPIAHAYIFCFLVQINMSTGCSDVRIGSTSLARSFYFFKDFFDFFLEIRSQK